MLNITLKELREEEFASVEKVTFDIAARMKGNIAVMPTQLFGMAYLAYLVADSGIENVEELIEYVDKELPMEQTLFVREAVKDAWSVAIDIGVSYTTETLVATLLWMPTSNGRYGAEMETPESVAKLATKILSIKNDNVADFCSGTGNFLMEAIEASPNSEYYGIEINTHCKEISVIRLQLISEHITIEQGNVLEMDASKKFDKIFCDYPWSMKVFNL